MPTYLLFRAAHILCDGDIPLDDVRIDLVRYIVESLRAMPEHSSLLVNWSALVRALQTETKSGRRVESAQQRILLRMLVCSVELEIGCNDKKSDVDQIDPDLLDARVQQQSSSQPASKKRKKDTSSSAMHEEMTIALLRPVSALLGQVKTDAIVLRSVTELPQYFCECLSRALFP